jgi:hypothetical protein
MQIIGSVKFYEKTITNDDKIITWKEAVMAYLNVISRYRMEGLKKKKDENPQWG